jgi:hypothetical protein
MHLGGVTASPTGEWTAGLVRNLALTLREGLGDISFLIRGCGSNFTASFDAVFQAAGTRILRTAVRTPGMNAMNAICERLAGTLRRELLDRVLILGEHSSMRSECPARRMTISVPDHREVSLPGPSPAEGSVLVWDGTGPRPAGADPVEFRPVRRSTASARDLVGAAASAGRAGADGRERIEP